MTFDVALREAELRWAPAAGERVPAPPGAPKSVVACLGGAWSLLTLSTVTGAAEVWRFCCKSWRCPSCRYQVARSDFARILEGLTTHAAKRARWMLWTLTFDPARYPNAWAAYRAAQGCFQRLRQRLGRLYGSRANPARMAYLAVWEQHKSGWPHVHIAVRSPEIEADVRRRELCSHAVHGCGPQRRELRTGRLLPNWAWGREVLRPLLEEVGFGRIYDLQFARAKEGGVAGYFAKLGAELVGCFDQRPAAAPRHFRRLRASRGLLPPRHRPDGTRAGRLVQQPPERVTRVLDRIGWPVPAGRSRPPCPDVLKPARIAGRRRPSRGCPHTRQLAPGARPPPQGPPPPLRQLPLPLP